MERLTEKRLERKRNLLAFARNLALIGFGGLALMTLTACIEKLPDASEDGYTDRSVQHEVINPLNEDKYTTFNFFDRTTQTQAEVDFHHLKSNPEKFERLISTIDGQSRTVLEMKQENVPLDKIEFQHSRIQLLNTTTNQIEILQINRIKPTDKDAPKVTAYSLFFGDEDPQNIGNFIISDETADGGQRGEVFVSLAAGAFNFSQTSERFATAFSQKAGKMLADFKAGGFKDPQILQAVWREGKNWKGILKGASYSINIENGGRKIPGRHVSDENFKSAEIVNAGGKTVAKITTEHFNGTKDGDSVLFNFLKVENGSERVVAQILRTYRDKSEIQTSHGTGFTTGISSGGSFVVGWTSIDFQTPVNYQNENTFLSSFGARVDQLNGDQIEENSKFTSGILVLLGGASIIEGLNFRDTEIDWQQSSSRIIAEAERHQLKSDMGFWMEAPVDATAEGLLEASKVLAAN